MFLILFISLTQQSTLLSFTRYFTVNTSFNLFCQLISLSRVGAYDGTLFPKHFEKEDKFFVYRKAFCRKLAIEYHSTQRINNIEVYRFTLAESAFDDKIENPETICYCNEEKVCAKRGLGNISPCYLSNSFVLTLLSFLIND